MNAYKNLKEKHQNEVNTFPMSFAFSNEQFEEGMRKLGLEPTDKDKIYGLTGGGFYRKSDAPALHEMFARHEKEMKEAIDADKTGKNFIYDMFDYELANHEYGYTEDPSDAIYALGLTIGEVNNNPILLKSLKKVCSDQREWYLKHG